MMRRIGGLVEEILEIAMGCTREEEATVRANLAVGLARKGRFEEARQVADAIPHPYTRAFAFARLTEVTADQKDAEACDEMIRDDGLSLEEKVCAGAKLAMVLKDIERAEYVLGLSRAAAGGQNHRSVQRFVIMMLAGVGRVPEARECAQQILDARSRATAFAEIAAVSGDKSDIDHIEILSLLLDVHMRRLDLVRARAVADSLTDGAERAKAFLLVAATSRDERDLKEAIKASEKVAGFRLDPLNLSNIGISSAKIGDLENARRIADTIARMTSYKRRRWLQTRILTAIFEEMPES